MAADRAPPVPDEAVSGVAVFPPARAAALLGPLQAAGWRTVPPTDAMILLVDGIDAMPAEVDALRQNCAVLAIVAGTEAEAAARAYAAGATHWLRAGYAPDALAQALRFAGRYARRLRGLPREAGGRRASDEGAAGDDRARAWLSARAAGGGGISAAVVALTRFDFVNAAFGRSIGDALLATAQARIESWARTTFARDALVARRQGAEFVVVAAAGKAAMARALAACDAALAAPYEAGGASINLGSRIGIATRSSGEAPDALLARAREALVVARTSDGATTSVADTGVPIDRLAADLHRALERGEIGVLFQPQVAFVGDRIIGVEALARWEHPTFGALGAERLFAAAERADLGIALSDHIQRLALERAARWGPPLDGLRLSINVTAAELARPGFATALLDRIGESGFARARVTVEIVETGLLDPLDRAAALLAQLRGAGCRIAIDDFGTGYSSLAYLKALPIDYLKIDRSLTQDIAGSPRDRIIIRGVLAMARSLGFETIAEGVETSEQRALLAEEGCTYYQGFLCAGPLDEIALARLIEGRAV